MKFTSGLRPFAPKRLQEIESADILAGTLCYNNQGTIEHLIQMVTHGLDLHYRNLRSVIMIADGGSTDETRGRRLKQFETKPWQQNARKGVFGQTGEPRGGLVKDALQAVSTLPVGGR